MNSAVKNIQKLLRNPKRYLPTQPRQWIGVVLVIAILAFGGWWIAQNPLARSQSENLQVATSFYPLYDIARNVGGDKASVINVTPAGHEPHDYEPNPQQLVEVQNSRVFIYNGANFEPWVPDFLEGYKHTAVAANSGLVMLVGGHEHDLEDVVEVRQDVEHYQEDPHYWLDPVLMQQATRTVRDAFIAADPANTGYYTAQADAYVARLHALDGEFRQGLANCQQNAVVSSHDSISYLATRYGFMVWPIAGFDPESEPSPAALAELSETIRLKGISTVLFETLASPRLAQTLADEVGAQTAVINPLEGVAAEDEAKGSDYVSVQQQNLAVLHEVLQCQ